MNRKTAIWDVSSKLTTRQQDAIQQNNEGNALPLIRCLYESVKAIDKITAMGAMGATKWAAGSAAHHIEIRDYLFAQVKPGAIRDELYRDIFSKE